MILPVAWNRAVTGRVGGGVVVVWGRDQRPVIYCIAFNIRKAALFAEAPGAPSLPSALAEVLFFFFFKPRAALPAGCRCCCRLRGLCSGNWRAARRSSEVEKSKGAKRELVRRCNSPPDPLPGSLQPPAPPGFLHHHPPAPLAGTFTSQIRRQAPRGHGGGRGGGRRRLPCPGWRCHPLLFPPEARRSGVFLLLLLPLPAGIGFFSFPRQERVNKTLLLLASMAAKSLLTLRGRPKRFPF